MECHLVRVDKGKKRIMNLDLILDFGEIWYINVEIGGSEEQAKFGFLVITATTCKANFKK